MAKFGTLCTQILGGNDVSRPNLAQLFKAQKLNKVGSQGFVTSCSAHKSSVLMFSSEKQGSIFEFIN